jgi:deoxycytidylate deaminase
MVTGKRIAQAPCKLCKRVMINAGIYEFVSIADDHHITGTGQATFHDEAT